MKTSSARNVRSWLWGLLFCLAPVGVSHAATVAIDSLLINYASLTIAITNDGTTTFAGPIAPPVQIVMGTYQDPIVQLSSGSLSAKIYSTAGTNSIPAPSGSVDTLANTINVDFSSLRASGTVPYGSFDVALWPITNPPSDGTYNPGTGAYVLTWSNPFSLLVHGQTISGTATVSLSGTATLVPVPAALWLLGSGLLGLAGIARRRRTSV